MKKILMVTVVFAVVFFTAARNHVFAPSVNHPESAQSLRSGDSATAAPDLPSQDNNSCDGRTYCSQMTSCEEATYFINHCPNTKMDGDHDGVPCEKQWCNGS
jgi:hypothetical protein